MRAFAGVHAYNCKTHCKKREIFLKYGGIRDGLDAKPQWKNSPVRKCGNIKLCMGEIFPSMWLNASDPQECPSFLQCSGPLKSTETAVTDKLIVYKLEYLISRQAG